MAVDQYRLSKVSEQLLKRAKLVSSVRLEISGFLLFEMDPSTPYDLYMRNFNAEGLTEDAVQCPPLDEQFIASTHVLLLTRHSNRDQVETQTEEPEYSNQCAQVPDDMGLTWSESSDKDKQQSVGMNTPSSAAAASTPQIAPHVDTTKLLMFLRKTGALCSRILDSRAAHALKSAG